MPNTEDRQAANQNILIWLPWPMGDAVACTPALRAIRSHFSSAKISFFANKVVRQTLSPCEFNDRWLEQDSDCPFAIAKMLKTYNFTHAVLFKNSFASALAVFLARIPVRIGYARDVRALFLTDRLRPPKISTTKFKPLPMIDYYLAVASWLGADSDNRKTELSVDRQQFEPLKANLPQIEETDGPVIVLVPGGAFGPSKRWPAERFARLADWLIKSYNAAVIVSVSDAAKEMRIAGKICSLAGDNPKLVNLAQKPVTICQLKALFSTADLVITNDTGPRHIAIALKRKVITLFGPNNPDWTDTDYENEIKIIGGAPCAPCDKPVCKKSSHLCMEAITVEMVCQAVQKLVN